MTQTLSILWTIAAGILLVISFLAVLFYFDLQMPLINFVNWLNTKGWWAPVVFILIDMLFVVLLLPSILLTLSAGFLFGFLFGGGVIVLATTGGSILAFLISRYLLGQSVKDYLREHKRMQVVNQELVAVGWRVILLTRLIPFFPLKLSNYFFGATHFRLFDFIIGTGLGILPNTFFIVYLGSLASDLAMLDFEQLITYRELWWFYVLAVLILIIAVVYIVTQCQRALDRYEARIQKGKNHVI